ncbi:hypothetical protein [Amycolatopsis sp. PS_44_ISF1]|uniref:hypothetical protein n=1 Tax=Amycolatopsis sp. PS_44_ISF1 TaxID=2974917 RepID=UPI0028DFD6CC|nr:hypothetical protein [Amycolatopsis sp. PS_44_ISF1]MDT8913621.1 hypothetical protein [Amycolatopsis sp. PS_44_ISF1]
MATQAMEVLLRQRGKPGLVRLIDDVARGHDRVELLFCPESSFGPRDHPVTALVIGGGMHCDAAGTVDKIRAARR